MMRLARIRNCIHCKQQKPVSEFGRYVRNGRLMVVCLACDAELNAARKRTAEAKARGYADWTHTPEYKRKQREAEASKAGRKIGEYVPVAERGTYRKRLEIERQSDLKRLSVFRQWIGSIAHCERDTQADIEARNARFRESYWKRPDYERARTANYKSRNWDRKRQWDAVRAERIRMTSDGTATAAAIDRLKAAASDCPYCGKVMDAREKQTDHVIALCNGGAHSLKNIVIACASCNGRKARLEYRDWLERQSQEQEQAA